LIERPPRFGSRRFREILVPAFKGDPITALGGLYWMATRRRVRGWGRLVVAAARAPLNYQRWVGQGEVRALADFMRQNPLSGTPAHTVVLLLDNGSSPESVDTSIRSIRAALADPIIYSPSGSGVRSLPEEQTLGEMISLLAQTHRSEWLFPVVAGDQVSHHLGDILARYLGSGAAELVYWDEDLMKSGARVDPWVKPDWDSLLFGRLGGLLGASVVSFEAFKEVAAAGGQDPLDRAGIERLLLDVATARRPSHIPLILTHRGMRSPPSTAATAVPAAPVNWPGVSIIIPTRDKPALLAACLSGIDQTDYPAPIQIVIVDNGSQDPAAVQLIEGMERDPRCTVVRDEGEFNFSRLNNLGARAADGELLCLLNNDVEPLDGEWLKTLVRYALEEEVGAVGAQLVYPSGRIQHAGVAVGLGGAAGHVQKGVDPDEPRFWTWQAVTREVSALTAAVLVLRKSRYEEVGGFDEGFAVAFNDIDFCLRLKQRGLRNIYVADVRLLHRESESRGKDRTPERARRFAGELARLQERWGTEEYRDPHFSPLFSALVERCVLNP
jgi:O-antigen biosynthesis protein